MPIRRLRSLATGFSLAAVACASPPSPGASPSIGTSASSSGGAAGSSSGGGLAGGSSSGSHSASSSGSGLGSISSGGSSSSTSNGSDSGDDARSRGNAASEGGSFTDGSARTADVDVEAGTGCTASGSNVFGGGPSTTSTTHLDIGVHDPSMIWDGSRYYLFATGGTLNVRSSADILTWSNAGNVFQSVPAWVSAAVGSAVTDLWAPDVSYFNGLFHVYYAGSTFGSNTSVIGLATTPSLESPTFADQGLVVQSTSSDNYNAIDPNVTLDQNCAPWLAFGSFWSGIKLRKLDPATGKLAADDTTLYSLASRPNSGGAIEAASIITHNGYYYLFASFDACCKGVNSTYNTNYGRATKITGPYANKAGTDMMQGGAELLLASSGRYIGPGGGTAWQNGDSYLYVYHYYDGQAGGASKLQIRPIHFDAGDWISLGDPLFP